MYKKNNNKFRNGNNNNHNNNNNQYSLTYKFDSSSIAGKMSGTALDLIKKYNELAKEALSNHDYISAETFKQYAEHYRKIVTEINERKNNKVIKTNEVEQKSPDAKEVEKVEDSIKAPQEQEANPPKKKTLRKKLVVVDAAKQ